jgi:hypothetical protein
MKLKTFATSVSFSLITTLITTLVTASALAEDPKASQNCSLALKVAHATEKLGNRVIDFGRKVHSSKGGSLFFNPTTEDPAARPGYGFLSPYKEHMDNLTIFERPFVRAWQQIPGRILAAFRSSGQPNTGLWRRCLRGDPDYAVTLSRGLVTCLVDIPASKVSQRLNRGFVTSGLILNLLVGGAPAMVVTTGLVNWNQNRIAQIQSKSENKKLVLYSIDLLQYDPRFSQLREQFKNQWSTDTAYNKALAFTVIDSVAKATNADIEFLNSFNAEALPPKVDSVLWQPQFSHLQADVRRLGGLAAVSDSVWNEVLLLNWGYRVLINGVSGPEAAELRNSDFFRALEGLEKEDRITEREKWAAFQFIIYARKWLTEAALLGRPLPEGMTAGAMEDDLLSRLAAGNKSLWQLPGTKPFWDNLVTELAR